MHLIVAGCEWQPFETQTHTQSEILTDSKSVATPALEVLVASWREVGRLGVSEDAWDWPAQRVYAAALGLPSIEGGAPWAAYETGTTGVPCAWIEPCHIRVGINDMLMLPQSALQLSVGESRALMDVMAPYFAQDGITLGFHSATRWLATGEVFRRVVSAPLSLVEGRDLDAYWPDADNEDAGVKVRRLQNEMQMLLYTHAMSQVRSARGLLPVNSFWVSGAGVLDTPVAARADVKLDGRLLDAARSGEPAAYEQAWIQIERDVQAYAAQGALKLTLGGRKQAMTWQQCKPGWKHKISSFLGLLPAPNIRKML